MTKQRNTKQALLTSGLALLMCISMLVGSTFAWFTDSVESKNNIIKSGTLDVTMEWAEGDENPTTAQYADASKGAIFNSQLWEPGYTEAKHIKVSNIGTLALKYQMRILANGVVSELADVIDVYYFPTATQLTSTNYTSGTRLGTLSEVLNNKHTNAISKTIVGTLEKGQDKTVTIALHMQESAGNEYQGLSIGSDFSIQLLATQYTSEEDSFGKDYDAKADYASQEIPAAMVSSLNGEELDIDYTLGINPSGDTEEVILDAGYQFEPTETHDQALASKYANAHADFYVYADQDVKEGSLAVAGYYDAWCQMNQDRWVAFPAPAVKSGEAIRLIADGINGGATDSGITVSYEDICEYGNDGIGFRCGIVGLDDSVAGTTITVELRIYETYPQGQCPEDHNGHSSANCETGEYITIGKFSYTFDPVEVDNAQEFEAALNNGSTAIKLPEGNYSIPSAVAGKDITIIGDGDDTVFDFTTAAAVNDASITFENVKFQGKNENVMSGFGIQHTTGDVVYKNCTFDGAVTSEFYGNVSYIDCTFTGIGYITTYSVKSATFENCVFDKADSRAVLVYSHGDNPCVVNLKNCEFKAAEKAQTWQGYWTAAIEIDTTNIPTLGTKVTIIDCTQDANYSGLYRDKSADGTANAVIEVKNAD